MIIPSSISNESRIRMKKKKIELNCYLKPQKFNRNFRERIKETNKGFIRCMNIYSIHTSLTKKITIFR